jgi:hypothetical protein
MKKLLNLIVIISIISSLFTTVSFADSREVIDVTGVTLSLNLTPGNSGQLTATVAPSTATNKEVTFSSSNTGVATVTGAFYNPEAGTTSITVNAIAAGNAVITATTADGNQTAVFNVTVTQPLVPTAALSADNSVKPESSFTVAVNLNNLEQNVYAEDLILSYDSSIFEYVSAAGANSNIQIIEEDKAASGKVRLIAANIGGVSGASTKILNLTFKVKAGVQNTTGTIAATQAKLGVAPDGTMIEAALGSKSIAIGNIEVVDNSALVAAISNGESLYDNAVVGTLPGQYPQGAKDAFGAAINAAKAVKDNQRATQSQVDSAVTALNSAVDTFKAAVMKQVSADLNKDGSIDVGDLAMVAYHYGKDSTGTDWATAKIADMNNDNKIDIMDLAYVASKLLE